MDSFAYDNGRLFCEQVAVDELVGRFGSPLYIYSRKTLERHFDSIAQAFEELNPLICFSIKSCGNIHICKLLVDRGAGMDVVSGGELHRAKKAGTPMDKVVYAGVGKTDAEIQQAIEAQIGLFNIESEAEFKNITSIAERLNRSVRGVLRVNPDVADARTHQKTTTGLKGHKFGVDIDQAPQFFASHGHHPMCRLQGIHLHIGSPIYSPQPYVNAVTKALGLIDQLRRNGFTIQTLNIGGGFAADYETGTSPAYSEYAEPLVELLKDRDLKVILEPGRTIVANAGALITQVQYLKSSGHKKFVIVDSGFNHLLRPAMYEAFHFIWPTKVELQHMPTHRKKNMDLPGLEQCDVVGPLCETGDVLTKNWAMPPVTRGDSLCVFSAGAYGMVMASNYNAMPRPAEVLIDQDQTRIIRRRETYTDLIAPELNASSL